MIIHDQELNLRNAVAVSNLGITAIKEAIDKTNVEIDMSALKTLDSSAIAVMVEWQRCAQSLNKQLHFTGVSASIISLLAVYGLQQYFTITPITPINTSVRH
jgi:phospholipid transport system transporter-binding protein